MYIRVTEYSFRDTFLTSDYKNNFSYDGLTALYDYFSELEDELCESIECESIEFDLIAIAFLSCLCGSEHLVTFIFKPCFFLSCLCGSELGF